MAHSSSEPRPANDQGPFAGEAGVPLFADVDETLVDMQAIVGRKWLPIIVYHLLADGPTGFSALKGAVDGISSKMLSESLDDLQAADLVTRELVSDKPVRVEYDLTERGHALEGVVVEMVRWGTEYGVEDDTDDPSEAPTTETTGEYQQDVKPAVQPGGD
jgi:DNA-binding HxlR family transcriptional regulator